MTGGKLAAPNHHFQPEKPGVSEKTRPASGVLLEALRFHKLDLFTVTLRQIGADIARELMKDAVDIVVGGDGNDNAVTPTKLAGKPTYTDMVNLWGAVFPMS